MDINECGEQSPISTNNEYTSEETIIKLLIEYEEQRNELKRMISDIENLKSNIDKLFPQKLDARYQRFFEEKVKTATNLLSLLLDIRKEITKTIKDEIEIRRRIKDPTEDGNIEELLNIRSLVKKVEGFDKKTSKTKEKLEVIN